VQNKTRIKLYIYDDIIIKDNINTTSSDNLHATTITSATQLAHAMIYIYQFRISQAFMHSLCLQRTKWSIDTNL